MLCRFMHWSYPDLLDVPADVYEVLVDMVIEECRDPDAIEEAPLPTLAG